MPRNNTKLQLLKKIYILHISAKEKNHQYRLGSTETTLYGFQGLLFSLWPSISDSKYLCTVRSNGKPSQVKEEKASA